VREETEQRINFYAAALRDEQARSNVRTQEWRGFRDEEHALRVDAEDLSKELLVAVQALSRDVSLLLEIHRMEGRLRG
jgi:hypothetical protein